MINETFKEVFNNTVNDAIRLLNENGRCAIIRPTGFGKTVLMCQIARSNGYKNVLYVYPTEIVRKQAMRSLGEKKVSWITYTTIGKYHNNIYSLYDKIHKSYDLIIFDEMHHMGANNVKKTIEGLLEMIDTDKINILGSTATPKRMDGYDVIDKFFNNSVVFYYGINEAIRDNIITKMTYVYSADGKRNISDTIDDKIRKYTNKHRLKDDIKISIRDSAKKLDRITNAHEIIGKKTRENYKNTLPRYMKFLVFFSNKSILKARYEEIKEWFRMAFPEYNINNPITVVSGLSSDKAIDKLNKLECVDGHIDLVFSINMLNEGYHIDNITGIVLLRPTRSPIVYTQQIGRCVQIGIEHNPVIFDFVSNIEMGTIFNLNNNEDRDRKSVNPETLAEQLDRINAITRENVYIVDNVAEVRRVIAKIEESLTINTEANIIELRKKKYPAEAISEIENISLWEVYKVIEKYDYILRPLGLQKCEADLYHRGIVREGERIGSKKDTRQ